MVTHEWEDHKRQVTECPTEASVPKQVWRRRGQQCERRGSKRVTRFISPGPSPGVASKWEVSIGAGSSDPGRGHWWTKMLPRTWGTEFSLLGKGPLPPSFLPPVSFLASLLSLFLLFFFPLPSLTFLFLPPSLPYSTFCLLLKDGLPIYSGCPHTSNPPASACPELRL